MITELMPRFDKGGGGVDMSAPIYTGKKNMAQSEQFAVTGLSKKPRVVVIDQYRVANTPNYSQTMIFDLDTSSAYRVGYVNNNTWLDGDFTSSFSAFITNVTDTGVTIVNGTTSTVYTSFAVYG